MTSPPPNQQLDPTRNKEGTPLFNSGQLFRQGREVLIEHQGEIYRLQLTRNGKLILIK
jgi:hemin uptake protein HemP